MLWTILRGLHPQIKAALNQQKNDIKMVAGRRTWVGKACRVGLSGKWRWSGQRIQDGEADGWGQSGSRRGTTVDGAHVQNVDVRVTAEITNSGTSAALRVVPGADTEHAATRWSSDVQQRWTYVSGAVTSVQWRRGSSIFTTRGRLPVEAMDGRVLTTLLVIAWLISPAVHQTAASDSSRQLMRLNYGVTFTPVRSI